MEAKFAELWFEKGQIAVSMQVGRYIVDHGRCNNSISGTSKQGMG